MTHDPNRYASQNVSMTAGEILEKKHPQPEFWAIVSTIRGDQFVRLYPTQAMAEQIAGEYIRGAHSKWVADNRLENAVTEDLIQLFALCLDVRGEWFYITKCEADPGLTEASHAD